MRFAWRTLRRGPGLVIAATVILAFGIGLNGLVFGVVNGLLLRPLPAADAGRLVALYRTDPRGDGTGGTSIWGHEFEDEFSDEPKHDRCALGLSWFPERLNGG